MPLICVGNLSVGGTGKSPHIEYIVQLFNKELNVATLSRGYKRKSKGFQLAQSDATIELIGDEPLQFKRKFNDLVVAVDEDRVHGVAQLIKKQPNLDLILLDDAYQHRAIKAGVNILITEYNNLFLNDYLLPSGRLRDWRFEHKRADIIVISKSPKDISNTERKEILSKINSTNNQHIYFSYINYAELNPFTKSANSLKLPEAKALDVLLITGIGNPTPLFQHVSLAFKSVTHLSYPDHHTYTGSNINSIKAAFNKLDGNNKIIISTEKDIMRLSLPSIFKVIQEIPIFYIPIKVEFNANDKKGFENELINYVRPNKGN